MSPIRVQRQRTKGWRTPQCTCGRGDPHPAIYVGRGSRWGNPYKAGTTQIRLPGAENPNIDWEIEGRLGKPNGENVPSTMQTAPPRATPCAPPPRKRSPHSTRK